MHITYIWSSKLHETPKSLHSFLKDQTKFEGHYSKGSSFVFKMSFQRHVDQWNRIEN